jgi:hypothetical protein
MKSNIRLLAVLLLPLAGFGLAVLFSADLAPAEAGGVCGKSNSAFITSGNDGQTLYEWNLGTTPPSVIRYHYPTGTFTKKDLRPGEDVDLPVAEPEDPKKAAAPPKKPEVEITGVIWTPNPATRVAFINGKTVQEGEIFETASGKRYRVIEIKRTRDVVYREVKD